MTRIIGGRWKGRGLEAPKGSGTRPTSEKVRGAVANSLAAAGGVDGATVLDLYAGTGALGLELASRGARRVVMVESDRAALRAIQTNIDALLVPRGGAAPGSGYDAAAAPEVTVIPADVASFARTPGDAFDVVLADPPYELPVTDLADVLADLVRSGRLRPAADIIVEVSVRSLRAAGMDEFPWPEAIMAERSKRYGDTLICYGRGS